MSRLRPDFTNIRLSAAGLRMAGDAGTIGWANGRRHFHFVAGEEQEVERSFEWNHLLRHECFEGEPILEEVPDEAEVGPETVSKDEQPRGSSRKRDAKDGE